MELHYVKWMDHHGFSSWQPIECRTRKYRKDCICESIGWLLDETDTEICIYASKTTLGDCNDGTIILKSCILDHQIITVK